MKLISAFVLSLLHSVAFAQSASTYDETLKELSKDLSGLQHALDVARARSGLQAAYGYPIRIQVTKPATDLFAGAADNTRVVQKGKQGQTFLVVDKAGDWYAVALPRPSQGQDVAWVRAAEVVPTYRIPATQQSSSDIIYNTINEQIRAIKEKYKENPYIYVKGFSVSLGTNLSVAVSFEFK